MAQKTTKIGIAIDYYIKILGGLNSTRGVVVLSKRNSQKPVVSVFAFHDKILAGSATESMEIIGWKPAEIASDDRSIGRLHFRGN